MTISHSFPLGMRNVSSKSCRENQNTQFMFTDFFFPENCDIYEIMSKNMVEPGRTQKTWHLHMACWISKPTCEQAHSCARAYTHTHTHTQKYVILIACHSNSGFVNVPQCYVAHTLPVCFM